MRQQHIPVRLPLRILAPIPSTLLITEIATTLQRVIRAQFRSLLRRQRQHSLLPHHHLRHSLVLPSPTPQRSVELWEQLLLLAASTGRLMELPLVVTPAPDHLLAPVLIRRYLPAPSQPHLPVAIAQQLATLVILTTPPLPPPLLQLPSPSLRSLQLCS